MKFEHTLSPAAAQLFRNGVERLNALRLEQLRALGLAKEAEMKSDSLQQTITDQVAIIEQTEGLPAPVRPYQLSMDCTKLIGEVPDKPAAASNSLAIVEPQPIMPAPLLPVMDSAPAGQVNEKVNGVDRSGAERV